MPRRILIGEIAGQVDCRISRPGYDAALDDVNDRKKISFAASRPSYGQVAAAGFITGVNTWHVFEQAFGNIPVVMFTIKRGGSQLTGEVSRYTRPYAGPAMYRDGTPYVVVVEQGRMMITMPNDWQLAEHPLPAGDAFNFFCVTS
ncbi:hypothetical protein [Enterovirga sp. CN4-39]|uniref:hypothetical protein n=1 Tax=Enterovirga sp. CN4-39 TaxID=3400910 RepID=UPI003C0AD662